MAYNDINLFATKPPIEMSGVKKLMKNLYPNLKVIYVSELNSYQDKNFYLICKRLDSLGHDSNVENDLICFTNEEHKYQEKKLSNVGHTEKFVLKIHNHYSNVITYVEAQNEFTRIMDENGLICSRPIKNNYATEAFSIGLSSSGDIDLNEKNKLFVVQLLTFIEGKMLMDVAVTPQLRYECGFYLARLHTTLQDFQHEGLQYNNPIWDLTKVIQLRPHVCCIKDLQLAILLYNAIDGFVTETLPLLEKLEKGAIHGDFNDNNILVCSNKLGHNHESLHFNYMTSSTSHETFGSNLATNDYRIHGLVDFGDISYGFRIVDISIALAYIILQSQTICPQEIIQIGRNFIAGYVYNRKMKAEELSLIHRCVLARFCQTIVISKLAYLANPQNEYLMDNNATKLAQLPIISQLNQEIIKEAWCSPEFLH